MQVMQSYRFKHPEKHSHTPWKLSKRALFCRSFIERETARVPSLQPNISKSRKQIAASWSQSQIIAQTLGVDMKKLGIKFVSVILCTAISFKDFDHSLWIDFPFFVKMEISIIRKAGAELPGPISSDTFLKVTDAPAEEHPS